MLTGIQPLFDADCLEIGFPKLLKEFLVFVHKAFVQHTRHKMPFLAVLSEGNFAHLFQVIIITVGTLDESFQKFHGMTKEQAWEAVEKYRERYKDTGIYETSVIDGMIFVLETLKAAGKTLALATCKPEPFALKILEHFNLSKYFTVACGSNLDGTRKYKNEIIEEVFARLNRLEGNGELTEAVLDEMKADSIMVGDRKDDIYGAHNADIEAVGVRFGYAADGELEEAGADYIVNTVFELTALLLMDDDSVLCD